MRLQLDSTQASPVESRPAETIADNGQTGQGASGRASGAGDSISLSGASSALSRLATDRAARVQQLAAAVQNGSYRVSSSAVSAAIVRNGIS